MKQGAGHALVAAFLFGASAPLCKLLLTGVESTILAGFLYLGTGIGLACWRLAQVFWRKTEKSEAYLTRCDLPWLSGAILSGGILAPILLMFGLHLSSASSGSLLLNLEGVFTALLAWFVFNENFDRRIFLGILAIIFGGLLLSYQQFDRTNFSWGSLAIVAACFCWAVDNNLTRKVSGADPVQIAMIKGLFAGSINLLLGWVTGSNIPNIQYVIGAGIVGFFSYGVSLTCFVIGLRHLGAARTGAYFSIAPFFGALLSLALFREKTDVQFWLAAILMGIGVWLHLTERHEHKHFHEEMEHDHLHIHDEHHQHEHLPTDPAGEPHSHFHRHLAMIHTHAHVPDLHHRHKH